MQDAYAAGLFDGEGHVQISRYWVHKRKTPYMRYQLKATLNMCHAPTIHALYKTYGGLITREARPNQRYAANRIQYHWAVWSSGAADFLRRIQPYSITKVKQIDLAIEFQDHIMEMGPIIRKTLRHGGLPSMPAASSIYEWRDALIAEIKRLNKEAFDISRDDLRNPSFNCDGPTAAP